MIVPAFYEKQVMKIPVNTNTVSLTFTESGVYLLNTCWTSSQDGSCGVNYFVNEKRCRYESLYTNVDAESFGATFMKTFKSGDSITIRTDDISTIKFVLIWKVGNYVEN